MEMEVEVVDEAKRNASQVCGMGMPNRGWGREG
jgi:hypothetical protein